MDRPPRFEYDLASRPRVTSPIGDGRFARVSRRAAGLVLPTGRLALPPEGRLAARWRAPSAGLFALLPAVRPCVPALSAAPAFRPCVPGLSEALAALLADPF